MNLEELYRPFENVGERPGAGGKKFKYVKGAEVIDRLNKVFQGNWSLEIRDVIRSDDDVLVHVCLSVWEADSDMKMPIITKEQFGHATIKRYDSGPRQGQVIDYGNAFKSAVTDGIKKAASLLGVGLYLYDLDNPVGLENGLEEKVASKSTKQEEVKPKSEPTPPPFEEPEPPANPVVPDLVLPSDKKDDAPKDESTEDQEDNITDIQKCAIENMSKLKQLTVEEVIKAAISEDKPLAELTYTEAAAAIKHVNTLKTPKKS